MLGTGLLFKQRMDFPVRSPDECGNFKKALMKSARTGPAALTMMIHQALRKVIAVPWKATAMTAPVPMLMCGKVTRKNLIDDSPYSEKRKLKIFHFPY